MNRFLRLLAPLVLGGLLSIGMAQADNRATQATWLLASANYPARSNNTPDNGAIRRANPNSRQGTESITPSIRGSSPAITPSRPPTLENGGIGNGYPTRQNAPRPSGSTPRSNN